MAYGYLSFVGLSLCALVSLSIIGLSYFLKINNKKLTITNKAFLSMIAVIFMMIIFELLSALFLMINPELGVSIILGRVYYFFKYMWFIVFCYYVINMFFSSRGFDFSKNYLKKFNILFVLLLILCILVSAFFPLAYIQAPEGYFFASGLLENLTVIMSVVTFVTYFIFILLNHKYFKGLILFLSSIMLVIAGGSAYLQKIGLFEVNDLAFNATLILIILYFTVESQDRLLFDELTLAKADAEKLDEVNTEFLLSMSREIRTPLNTILSHTELMLMDDTYTKEYVLDNGSSMLTASSELLTLINNILDVSRIESGKESVVMGCFRLDGILYELNNKIIPKIAQRKNLRLDITFDPELPAKYHGDMAKVLRIVSSLMENVLVFTDPGIIKFDVSGTTEGNFVDLKMLISFPGTRMSEDYFNVRFGDISKNDSVNSINSNSLGLIIAKKLVELFDGSVEFVSNEATGTILVVKFRQEPIDNEKVGDISKKLIALSGDTLFECDGKTALIVDDSEINLKVAKKLLERFKFKITTAMSGQECLDLLNDSQYDIVFLDHMMPGMDGVETLNRISSVAAVVPPVIALTANAEDSSKDEYVGYGFTDYLAKPMDLKEVNRVVKKIFDKGN